MITNSLSILFHLRKPKGYLKGNVPVYMRITVRSERTEIAVGREFDSLRRNKKAERATGTKEDRPC